jgi:hypothetical protein
MAMIQHKQDHGDYPKTLDALAMDVPVDPFTGNAMLYHPQDVGFMVDGVGQDKQDDYGQIRKKDSDDWGIVWLYGVVQ